MDDRDVDGTLDAQLRESLVHPDDHVSSERYAFRTA
jgi:hypothetical protein